MGVGAGLNMHDVVVKKFTFAISSPDEFLVICCFIIMYMAFFQRFKNRNVVKTVKSVKTCRE